jgi:tyrosine-protein kinase Etk/Wzc
MEEQKINSTEGTPANSNRRQELLNVSIRDIFYRYIRFFPLFILSVAVALLAAFMYLRYSTNIYSAAGTLLIKQDKSNSQVNDRVEDIISGGNRKQDVQNEIEILKSKALMTRVVEKLKLQYSYLLEGRVKDMNMYGRSPIQVEILGQPGKGEAFSVKLRFDSDKGFFVNDNSNKFQFGEVVDYAGVKFRVSKVGIVPAEAVYTVKWQPAEVAARGFIQSLKVAPKTIGTGIIAIGMETSNADLSADIVSTLMKEYGLMTVEQNNFSADTMIAFIDGRLRKLKDELDSIQLIELEFRQQENLFNVDIQSENYFNILAEANKAISEQEIRINTVNNVEAYIRDKQNQFNRIVPSSLGLEDITLNELVMGYNKAQLERQILLNSDIPVLHPAVKESEAVIEKQRQNLVENLGNLRFAYNNTIGKLRQKVNQEQGGLKKMPQQVKQLVEVQRQISTKLALYNLLEGKREETAISRASTISNSTIVDPAEASTVPVKPNRRLIQALAVAIGFIIPAIVIFLIEIFNDKVNSRTEVEKLTDVPIVGEVGHSYSKNTLVVTKESRGIVAEQFRIVRSNLQYILNHISRPVILVTSSFSGEGKSFVSTNMAAVMALTGKKTVLLEFDIRKPKVLSGLNMTRQRGISNYLLGNAELKDLIVPAPDYENFYILPCGPIPPNPAELLLDPKITEMFAWLKANFEVVIIDTAPVGMVSDAMALAQYADCSLYLVRQGYTFRKQLIMIDDLYKTKKLPKVSIIINDIKIKAGYGYYSYGRYGYGYGYGNEETYYEREEQPKSWWNKILAILNPFKWFKK